MRPQQGSQLIQAELIAVLAAVSAGDPKVLTIAGGDALPSGPFQVADRSLQSSLRAWVEQQTGHPPGYIEQLYTFADRDRRPDASGPAHHVISISYLGLMRERGAGWRGWYDYLPWEDHRAGPPELLTRLLLPRLEAWIGEDAPQGERRQRVAVTFGLHGHRWNEELALQRYELLWEAGLVTESLAASPDAPGSGRAMIQDHRRMLATAIARLRAKIKYRPVVFELMPPCFTLLQLQQSVEAIAGRLAHKQNFRRLIEQQELVEETGEITAATVGRPAKLFRFRRDVLAERAVLGTKPSLK